MPTFAMIGRRARDIIARGLTGFPSTVKTVRDALLAIGAGMISTMAGISVVQKSGNDSSPTMKGYLTVAAALSAWSSGVVIVFPGTYAENITIPDGCRVWLFGATIGTGAGPAATASGTAYVGGFGTLSATAALSAAAGKYFALGSGIDISGTVTGVYRVGRRWVLQSSEAIATYIPADGSVISDVTACDTLCDGNTGDVLTALTVVAATQWCTERLTCNITRQSRTSSNIYQLPVIKPASGVIYVDGFSPTSVSVGSDSSGNDASHNWNIGVYNDNTVIGSEYNTYTTVAQTVDLFYYPDYFEIGAFVTVDIGPGATDWGINFKVTTAAGTPGTLTFIPNICYREVRT